MKINTTRWLAKLLVPETDRADRRSADHFGAYYWSNSTLKEDGVRDISATGVYVVTNERWPLGTVVSLTLQSRGPLETNRERRITTRAKAVRTGDDGMGFAFVVPSNAEARLWDHLVENLVEQAKLQDMAGLVKVAEALKFLSRICSGAGKEVAELIRGRLSNTRLAGAVDIALKAQDFLSSEERADEFRADPGVVVRILETGSATEETWLRDFWAGLLVTSCSIGGKDTSGEGFVELFSQLTIVPLRILTVVCKATQFHSSTQSITPEPLTCSIGELITLSGAREFQIDRDLEKLSQMGLIEIGNTDSESAQILVQITPTPMALRLFARCHGHRDAVQNLHV
jgi:hypothetical protein